MPTTWKLAPHPFPTRSILSYSTLFRSVSSWQSGISYAYSVSPYAIEYGFARKLLVRKPQCALLSDMKDPVHRRSRHHEANRSFTPLPTWLSSGSSFSYFLGSRANAYFSANANIPEQGSFFLNSWEGWFGHLTNLKGELTVCRKEKLWWQIIGPTRTCLPRVIWPKRDRAEGQRSRLVNSWRQTHCQKEVLARSNSTLDFQFQWVPTWLTNDIENQSISVLQRWHHQGLK